MLETLVEISRYYGAKPGYALGGGGNTSFKNQRYLWVKASGYSLADISENGFAVLDRKLLGKISQTTYSSDPLERERQVKDDLMASNAFPGKMLRPSVEASLHNLIEYAYVVHTHPYLVNALTCSADVRKRIAGIFGDQVLLVPYVDPGYILFKRIESGLRMHRKKSGSHPHIIFLQNHGIFVSADTTGEIKSLYRQVFEKIRKFIKSEIKTGSRVFQFQGLRTVENFYQERQPDRTHTFKTRKNPLISHFISDKKKFQFISRPFIPDQIVYCKTHPLWLNCEESRNPDKIRKNLLKYEGRYGYLPRILLTEGGGMIGAEINEEAATLVLDVFEDAMKISYYSGNFGGPHFMNRRQISFIENWEVENYRRNLLVK